MITFLPKPSLNLSRKICSSKRISFGNKNVIFTGYGRTALEVGLLHCNIKEGDEILIPETICDVVLTSLNRHGIIPIYYRIKDDFTIDWDKITNLVTSKSKAFIGVNYFGFPQNYKKIILFCRKHNLIFIEDNAHGYGSKTSFGKLGFLGDISISCPRKNMSLINGAFLTYSGVLNSKSKLLIKSLKKQKEPKYKRLLTCFKSRIRCLLNTDRFRYDIDKYTNVQYGEKEYLDFQIFSSDFFYNKKYRYEILIRREIYLLWESFIKEKTSLCLIFELDYEINPYCFPVYANNEEERDLWLAWGLRNGVEITTWPFLPNNVIVDTRVLNRWKKLLLFPVAQTNAIKELKKIQSEYKGF